MTDPQQTPTKEWFQQKTLVIAWLIFFFPVGLYALWKNSGDFDKRTKWIITGAIVFAVLLLTDSGLFHLITLYILAPVAVYLLWKDPLIQRRTAIIFSAVFGGFLLVNLGAGEGDHYASSGGGSNDRPFMSIDQNGSVVGDQDCVYASAGGMTFKNCN